MAGAGSQFLGQVFRRQAANRQKSQAQTQQLAQKRFLASGDLEALTESGVQITPSIEAEGNRIIESNIRKGQLQAADDNEKFVAQESLKMPASGLVLSELGLEGKTKADGSPFTFGDVVALKDARVKAPKPSDSKPAKLPVEDRQSLRDAKKTIKKNVQNIGDVKNTISRFEEAQKSLRGNFVGPVDEFIAATKEGFGLQAGGGTKESEFRALIDDINAIRVHELYGSALSKSEQARSERAVLNLGMEQSRFKANLKVQLELLGKVLERFETQNQDARDEIKAIKPADAFFQRGSEKKRISSNTSPSDTSGLIESQATKTATNQETGEKLFLVDGKWIDTQGKEVQ